MASEGPSEGGGPPGRGRGGRGRARVGGRFPARLIRGQRPALHSDRYSVFRVTRRGGEGADAVHVGAADAGHRADPRQHAAGEGARTGRRRTGCRRRCGCSPSTARGSEQVPAGVHGRLPPALRGGADPQRAPRAGGRRGGWRTTPLKDTGGRGQGTLLLCVDTTPQAPCTRQRRMLCSRPRSVRG